MRFLVKKLKNVIFNTEFLDYAYFENYTWLSTKS